MTPAVLAPVYFRGRFPDYLKGERGHIEAIRRETPGPRPVRPARSSYA
jgi:hypothetical protein